MVQYSGVRRSAVERTVPWAAARRSAVKLNATQCSAVQSKGNAVRSIAAQRSAVKRNEVR